jgi:hypothetical protein
VFEAAERSSAWFVTISSVGFWPESGAVAAMGETFPPVSPPAPRYRSGAPQWRQKRASCGAVTSQLEQVFVIRLL